MVSDLLPCENAQPTFDLAGFFVLRRAPVVTSRYDGLFEANKGRGLQGHLVPECRKKLSRDGVPLRDHDHHSGIAVQAELVVNRARKKPGVVVVVQRVGDNYSLHVGQLSNIIIHEVSQDMHRNCSSQ